MLTNFLPPMNRNNHQWHPQFNGALNELREMVGVQASKDEMLATVGVKALGFNDWPLGAILTEIAYEHPDTGGYRCVGVRGKAGQEEFQYGFWGGIAWNPHTIYTK